MRWDQTTSIFKLSRRRKKDENCFHFKSANLSSTLDSGGKIPATDLVVNPVLSPLPLPRYGVRPLAFKNRLKQVKVFCHGETYSSLQSWNIISYFQRQHGLCARENHRLKLFSKQRAKLAVLGISAVLSPAALLGVAASENWGSKPFLLAFAF